MSRINQSSAERREGRVLLMVVSMVTGYLLCWMPYGVVAMLASFGKPGVVSPAASLIPSLLAKTSTVLNPVIYVLLNKQVPTFPFKYVTQSHPLSLNKTDVHNICWVSPVKRICPLKFCCIKAGLLNNVVLFCNSS